MGYTHYWEIAKVSKKQIETIVKECNEVLKPFIMQGELPYPDSMGTVTIDKQNKNCLFFNGVGELEHETMVVSDSKGFQFCKTARKPYDVLVVACLAIMKDILGEGISVTSDGEKEELDNGTLLASKMLGRTISNPIK